MTASPLHFISSRVHIGGYAHVRAQEILFCQSDSNYTHVHFIRKNKMTVATTLKTLENRLVAKGFIRANRSELVNRDYVKSYDQQWITLVNGATIPIARRRRKKVLLFLRMYIPSPRSQQLHLGGYF